MKVRAKFTVTRSAELGYGSGGLATCYRDGNNTGVPMREITLSPCYDKSNPEDVSFSEATPSGTINFTLTNPDLKDEFKPGTTYYVDFTPAQ
jgi:hypothetical protein